MARTYIPEYVRIAKELLVYLIRYQQQLGLHLDEQEIVAMNALINCLEAAIAVTVLQQNP